MPNINGTNITPANSKEAQLFIRDIMDTQGITLPLPANHYGKEEADSNAVDCSDTDWLTLHLACMSENIRESVCERYSSIYKRSLDAAEYTNPRRIANSFLRRCLAKAVQSGNTVNQNTNHPLEKIAVQYLDIPTVQALYAA